MAYDEGLAERIRARLDVDPAMSTVGLTLMLHFGVTGQLLCDRTDDAPEAHDRAPFTVACDRQLRYRDQRRLRAFDLRAG
ncbi:DNA-formamidopyrimidine glycosylase family protein [Streptomyces mirabilis]|uniref:DNA-formamidopyrimidine glycosylase family protein n=1 Tax=Streptomyces mirabilis TaxID=68239 RepID=UPI002250F651|nr:DNA-formamidopyrimidine glycosylase family protein [Streptomyces mirabilis]MCX4420314.1 hypothetical protein [Streptomyces mirabilis]